MKRILSLLITIAMIITVFAAVPIKSFAASQGSTAGLVNLSSGSLNVRSSQSTSSTVLTALSKGSYVTLISQSGSWWYLEYASGKYGYCSSAYIKQVSASYAAYINTSSGSLNVRTGAGNSYSIKGSLSKNTAVVVLSQSGGWSQILYNGTTTGYVNSTYVKAYSSSSTVAYSAISLSVPNYKQTDSRWSGVPIGTNGGTIATLGCATTSLAMTESYRTGTTITPSAMVSKLTYTAGGSVYWPSNYTFYFTNSYSDIYQTLKAGKPVLYAAKNASGGQHWVVITGYTGGSTLTASGFTINDPGSSSRTTLQQYLLSYPNFYKYAVYALLD